MVATPRYKSGWLVIAVLRSRNRSPGYHLPNIPTLLFSVYILYSHKCDRYYIGYSENPEVRLAERHNRGIVKVTRACYPYELKYARQFVTEAEAMAEERRLKRMKSRKYLEQLIEGGSIGRHAPI